MIHVYKDERVVVPKAITRSILQRIHNTHIGIRGWIRRAQDSLYWPNISRDIELYVSQCAACNTYRNYQQRELMISHEIRSCPWLTECDLFDFENHDYLILSDYYSDYFEVEQIHGKTANVIIRKMKAQFAHHCILDHVVSNNGPPLGSNYFAEFSKAYEWNRTQARELVAKIPAIQRESRNRSQNCETTHSQVRKWHKDPIPALLDFHNRILTRPTNFWKTYENLALRCGTLT